MNSKPIPLSLRRKSSARLAAVQCLYRLAIHDDGMTPLALYEDYMLQWHEDAVSPNRAMSFDPEPDRNTCVRLLSGVCEHKEDIDHTIRGALGERWTLERMSKVLVAILECAVYEMKHSLALKPVIIVNEYVNLAGRFFDPQEIGFVNGFLDSLAKQMRA